MSKRFRYSRTTRPAPILPIDIISPIHGRKRRVKFRVDTGADMSIVPGTPIPHLGTRAFSEVLVADDDGRTMLYKAHVVHVKLNGWMFENIEVVAPETDTAYLGQDILNQLKLTLDGPRKQLVVR